MDKKNEAFLLGNSDPPSYPQPPPGAPNGAPSSEGTWQPAPPPGEPLPYTEDPIEGVYIPRGGEEPPPEFTAYEAEFFQKGDGIVSHDKHLNEDGEPYMFRIEGCGPGN